MAGGAKRGRKPKSSLPNVVPIVPFDKRKASENSGVLPENASLEDYEMMAAKMAMSKDDVLDAAIGKLDPSSVRIEGMSISPDGDVSETVVDERPSAPSEKVSEPVREPDGFKTDDGSPDVQTEPVPEADSADTSRIIAENRLLAGRISALESDVEHYRSLAMGAGFRDEIVKLRSANDDLAKRNSELEAELSRTKTDNLMLRNRIESMMNERRLPPQVGIHTTNQIAVGRSVGRNSPRTSRVGMNGYESWC